MEHRRHRPTDAGVPPPVDDDTAARGCVDDDDVGDTARFVDPGAA